MFVPPMFACLIVLIILVIDNAFLITFIRSHASKQATHASHTHKHYVHWVKCRKCTDTCTYQR